MKARDSRLSLLLGEHVQWSSQARVTSRCDRLISKRGAKSNFRRFFESLEDRQPIRLFWTFAFVCFKHKDPKFHLNPINRQTTHDVPFSPLFPLQMLEKGLNPHRSLCSFVNFLSSANKFAVEADLFPHFNSNARSQHIPMFKQTQCVVQSSKLKNLYQF
jgi:hypothetical protein